MSDELKNTKDSVIAAQVLFYFGQGGYPAGGFFDLIYQAIQKADSTNVVLLMKAYPEHVAAMHLVMYNKFNGIDRLRGVSEGRGRLIAQRPDVDPYRPTGQQG